MSRQVTNRRLVEVRERLYVAGSIAKLGEVAQHDLALVTGPHDKTMFSVGEVVQDRGAEPRLDIAPRNSPRLLRVQRTLRGSDNRRNVNDLEPHPILRRDQPRILQSLVIPRLLLRQINAQNPLATYSQRTKRCGDAGIETPRHSYDKASCACFFKVSCEESFESSYCFFRFPNGKRIFAEPGGHSPPPSSQCNKPRGLPS